VSFLWSSARWWPATRAVARNWPIWILRQLLRPVVSLPCWITTRAGTRIRLDDDHIDDVVLRHVMRDAVAGYFPPVVVTPGGWILDVGAHHGIYAVEALRRNPGARLIAVEPDPSARGLITRNLTANDMLDRAELVSAALGSKSGSAPLVLGATSWEHSITPPVAGDASSSLMVRVMTASEVLAGRHPFLLKLNAEGAEFDVVPDLFALGIFPDWIVLMIHPYSGETRALESVVLEAGYEVTRIGGPALLHCRRTREP
jgi:FkbM family methyltransferase